MSVRVIDLDLDLLRCFLTVVESGGFTRASKRLHLTQSAITLKIKRLEDLLERRLFFPSWLRKPRGCSTDSKLIPAPAFRAVGIRAPSWLDWHQSAFKRCQS